MVNGYGGCPAFSTIISPSRTAGASARLMSSSTTSSLALGGAAIRSRYSAVPLTSAISGSTATGVQPIIASSISALKNFLMSGVSSKHSGLRFGSLTAVNRAFRGIIERVSQFAACFQVEVREGQRVPLTQFTHDRFGALGAIRVHAAVSCEVVDGGREGETGTGCVDDVDQVQEDVLLHREKLVVVAGAHVSEDFDVHRVLAEAREPRPGRFRRDHRMLQQQFADLDQHPAQLVGRGLVAQVDHGAQQNAVAAGEVLDIEVHKLGVGNGDDGPIERAHLHRSQPNTLDNAKVLAQLTEIAHLDRLVGKQGEAADEVLQRAARGQGHGQAADAETGDHALVGQRQDLGEEQDGTDDYRNFDERDQQRMQNFIPVTMASRVGFKRLADLVDEVVSEPAAGDGQRHTDDDAQRYIHGLRKAQGPECEQADAGDEDEPQRP